VNNVSAMEQLRQPMPQAFQVIWMLKTVCRPRDVAAGSRSADDQEPVSITIACEAVSRPAW
jgi:hypothetical protein